MTRPPTQPLRTLFRRKPAAGIEAWRQARAVFRTEIAGPAPIGHHNIYDLPLLFRTMRPAACLVVQPGMVESFKAWAAFMETLRESPNTGVVPGADDYPDLTRIANPFVGLPADLPVTDEQQMLLTDPDLAWAYVRAWLICRHMPNTQWTAVEDWHVVHYDKVSAGYAIKLPADLSLPEVPAYYQAIAANLAALTDLQRLDPALRAALYQEWQRQTRWYYRLEQAAPLVWSRPRLAAAEDTAVLNLDRLWQQQLGALADPLEREVNPWAICWQKPLQVVLQRHENPNAWHLLTQLLFTDPIAGNPANRYSKADWLYAIQRWMDHTAEAHQSGIPALLVFVQASNPNIWALYASLATDKSLLPALFQALQAEPAATPPVNIPAMPL